MPIGRSFFTPPDGRHADLGGGCEVWTGFYQSIRPSQWKTMLVNVDGEFTFCYSGKNFN